jgi:ribulose-phosphate 3-epimerase
MKPLEPLPQGILAPSILAADFSKLAEEIRSVESGVDWLHVDVMDGHFVPNLTIGPPVVKSLRAVTRLPLDCHLMVENPAKWVEPFARAGADILTVHVEASGNELSGTLAAIRAAGCRAGLSLNPATPVSAVEPFLDEVDLVLVMSVNPGFTGQKFMPEVMPKLARLAALRAKRKFVIEVDGGISKANIAELRKAGADAFVAGASIFFNPDRSAAIRELRDLITISG